MPPKKISLTQTQGKTSLEAFLFRIRDICRDKGVQMDENGNFYADLIYDDLLFLKSLWKYNHQGDLHLDVDRIIDGTTIKDIKLDSIASLGVKDPAHMVRVFNRLWEELQRSSLKSLFEREFAIKSILKDEKLKGSYASLLADLLSYTGRVELDEHECTDPYEYFSKDHKKAKSKYFGQFYTPMNLADVCVAEIKPKFGEIGADVAAGTGKFMRAAANYIHKNEPSHAAADAYNHMRMTEIEPRMYRQGIYSAFFSFQRIPDMLHQQRKGNSFELLIREKEQFDYVLANPPFGGTVLGFDEAYYDTVQVEKGKRLVSKQVPKSDIIYPFEIVKKDTCVLFLQLIVNKLKEGGRAAVILNGTIMTDQHRDVIKWFLEKCNLYKMIVCPGGTFQNTGIETYCFIFTKGTPTEKIEYIELGTNKKLGELTLDQIVEKKWDIRPIFVDAKSSPSNIITKSIDELCSITKGKVQASKAVAGSYPIYSAAANVSTHDQYDFEGEAVIFVNASRGPPLARVHYAAPREKFTASSLVLVLQPKQQDEISMKYLWYSLKLHQNEILKAFESSNMRETINESDFKKYKILLPPLAIQQEIVESLDRILADPNDSKDCLAFTSNAMDLMLKDPTGKLLEDVLGGLRLKRAHLANADSVKAQMMALVKSVTARGYEKKKLGDVCDDVSTSKNIPSSERVDGEFKFFTCSRDYASHNKSYYEGTYIVHGSRGSTIDESVFITENEKFAIGTSMFISKAKDEGEVKTGFIYYYLKFNRSVVNRHVNSSAIPMISKTNYYTIEIPIPPLAEQEKVLTMLNEMEAECKVLEQMAAKAEGRAKFILDGYLTAPQTESAATAPVVEETNTTLPAPIKKKIRPVLKKSVDE